MAHPVGGPLRTLSKSLRAEVGGSNEAAFRLARVVLRTLHAEGFVVLRAQPLASAQAGELEDALGEIARMLGASETGGEGKRAKPAPAKATSASPAGAVLEPPVLEALIGHSLDAYDALGDARADVARGHVEAVLQSLAQLASVTTPEIATKAPSQGRKARK
jgi:hypothetical protein